MNLSKFPERLSELMTDEGLNASQLNSVIGFSSSLGHKYLTGNYAPSVEMVVRIADYFNCTTDFLLGIQEENTAENFKVVPSFDVRFAQLLDYYRISRYKLGKISGLSESVLRSWAKGITKPSILNILRLAEKLNCSVDFVIGRELD